MIDPHQLAQINQENDYFNIIYAILNDYIGEEGKSAQKIYNFIIEEVPNNLKDFCENQSLKYLRKIRGFQDQIQAGQIDISNFLTLIEQFNAQNGLQDNIDVNIIR